MIRPWRADLRSLRATLKLICPSTDWSWLQSIANRIDAGAPPPKRKFNLVTSERLYALGLELMDSAVNAAEAIGRVRARQAIQYRDGLIISTLAMIPLRRGTLAALQFGRQLIKIGRYWELDIPGEDTKTQRPLDYAIPEELSARIDLYLERFRRCIRGSDKHDGVWPSHHNIPMRPELDKCRRIQKNEKGLWFRGQSASLPPRRCELLVSVRPRKRSRHQGPSRARNICHR